MCYLNLKRRRELKRVAKQGGGGVPAFSPYSMIPEPQVLQNSRVILVPVPLSDSCFLGSPFVRVKALRGILAVMPNGDPVNFYLMIYKGEERERENGDIGERDGKKRGGGKRERTRKMLLDRRDRFPSNVPYQVLSSVIFPSRPLRPPPLTVSSLLPCILKLQQWY